MLGMNDLKIGTTCVWKSEPYIVVTAQHVQMGRGGAILRTKLKNLITGNTLEETFKSGDRLEEAELGRSKASFLYRDGENFFFMDSTSFEQFPITAESLGVQRHFLKDGSEVELVTYHDRAIQVILPTKLEFAVTQTADAVKGNTASGNVSKEATIETGYIVKVPLFIKQGDTIRVNTETGEYVERA